MKFTFEDGQWWEGEKPKKSITEMVNDYYLVSLGLLALLGVVWWRWGAFWITGKVMTWIQF